MTRVSYPQEKNRPAAQAPSSSLPAEESEQILYLKRLLVTLKQQSEKKLHELYEDFSAEQLRTRDLQKELEGTQAQINEMKSRHDDEVQSLKNQQITLRDLLKKHQEEGPKGRSDSSASFKLTEARIEIEQLTDELEQRRQAIQNLEKVREQEKKEAGKEIDKLRSALAQAEEHHPDGESDVIHSSTSSYQLRQELNQIKETFIQGIQETKSLEKRYADMFAEKVELEQKYKQLEKEIGNQSSALSTSNEQIGQLSSQNQILEGSNADLNSRLSEALAMIEEANIKLKKLEESHNELRILQEKYEQLKEEYIQLTRYLEETIEMRLRAEKQLTQIDEVAKDQDRQLTDKSREIEHLVRDREDDQRDIQRLQELVGDAETRLKVAQQHLAKKVKEAALLSERVEEQQHTLSDYMQLIEASKVQASQLQETLSHTQILEKKLQDQFHEALRNTEIQISKWEKKYFDMYEKFQESENQVRELRKLEDKQLQMQNLLSNLGNFMGGGSFSPTQLFQTMQGEVLNKSSALDNPLENQTQPFLASRIEEEEEKYDLFGMRQSTEKYKQNLAS